MHASTEGLGKVYRRSLITNQACLRLGGVWSPLKALYRRISFRLRLRLNCRTPSILYLDFERKTSALFPAKVFDEILIAVDIAEIEKCSTDILKRFNVGRAIVDHDLILIDF